MYIGVKSISSSIIYNFFVFLFFHKGELAAF